MNIMRAIKILLDTCENNDLCIFTNGYISRFANAIMDRNANFYMVGSMGLASSVGLGLALNSSKRVIVFDGDGSFLMCLGAISLIGYEQPKKYVHLVFDNSQYASTGHQPTISGSIDFPALARGAGYKHFFSYDTTRALKKEIRTILNCAGPTLVHLKVTNPQMNKELPRIRLTPFRLTQRIGKAVAR